ncbi:MAG: SDR family oxidoreductase [Candidatus Helarchaeota archaeon]|jgi:3-oxoacyl-[acyl-carrier protein] reductase|nr:SDR family oxidoreductase [Candidatus Helarchaeota archaeon]
MMTRTALVTGASRGIGFAIANKLRESGIKTLTPARHELNLLSDASVDNYIQKLTNPIDILINNAGINPLAGITEITDSDIEDTFKVNFISPLRLIRGLMPSMIKRRFGRIVNISSIWGNVSKAKRSAYAASKSAINSLTRTVAVEVAKYNILVNALAPGFVNTELTRQNNTETEIKKISMSIPMGRLAEPFEIAEVVAFLSSEKNSYITGQTIIIDGGYTCL